MLLDERLYDRARLEARRQGKQIADVVGEALTEYLDERSALPGPADVVAASWGALRISRESLPHFAAMETAMAGQRTGSSPFR